MMDKRQPVLRLGKVLKRFKEEFHSYSALSDAIREASGGEEKGAVDRRKLKRIVDGENVSLSVSELIALDAFLSVRGEGLAEKPMLEKPWILQRLVEKGEVALLIGSYPRYQARRNDISRWDVQSLARLLSEIEKLRPGTQLTIDDLLFESSIRPEYDPTALPLHYLDDSGPSVSCIGSPRSCWAAEKMLASMFGVDPFRKPISPLPFYFIWHRVSLIYPSAFALEWRDIEDEDPSLAHEIEQEKAWAFKVGAKNYAVRRIGRKDWKVYGVVAAQRRASGQVWVVVSGLSGPATYGSAIALASQHTGTMPAPPGER